VFLTPGAPPMRKSDFAAAQAGLKQVQLRISSEIQEISITGEWAYCWNHLTIVATPRSGGAAVTRSGSSLVILKKQSGSWLLLRDANMVSIDP
jgi:ketosteroid isomerase-like protein